MKITRCDNHPEREAVTTILFRELPVGIRPLLFGYDANSSRIVDLCDECRTATGLPPQKAAAQREP